MNKETEKRLKNSLDSLILTFHQYMETDTVSARKKIIDIFLDRLKALLTKSLTTEQINELKEHIYMKVGDLFWIKNLKKH